MRRRDGFLACLLAALALGGPVTAAAQDATAPVASAAPAKSGPEVIPQSDIPLRADADERYAQDVIQRSQVRDQIGRLEPQLETLAKSVAATADHLKGEELQLLSVQRLESLARHWNFHAKQLEQWRRDLRQAAGQFTEDAAELARRRANWEATRAAATESGGIAPALSNRITTVLAQLSLAEQAVSGPIEQQMRLSRRANAIEDAIRASEKAVAAAIAYNDQRLSRIDSPPLWELWGDRTASAGAVQSMRAGLAIETRFLDEYNDATAANQRLENLFAVALLPLLLWLSRRSRTIVSDDPEIQASTRVLRRPISSWILLVLVSVMVFDPDAPLLLYQVALLLALIPVLRLLPPKVFEVLGPWPYVATGLYLLKQLGFLFAANPLYDRSYLLFVTVLTLVLTVWVLLRRRSTAAALPPQLRIKVLRGIGWLAVVALAVSAIANLFGNVSLAEMLTTGLLDAGYVGLVLYAGVTVLASVLRLLLARRVFSRFRIVTQHAGPLLDSFTRLLKLAAALAWVVVTLNQFRLLRPLKDAATAVLTYQLKFGQISITPGGVLLFLFSVWLAFWAARTVRVILQDEVLPKMSLPRGVGNSISSLTYYAMVMLGLMVALAAAGFEVSQLAIVVGALSVGIGFGLQNVVNNFVSGLILMFERPIQPGDVVEVSGTSGKVREIGMRATTLTTFEGADVVVPNGALLNEKLINWTLSDMDRRIDVNVGVAYGNDPKRVLELLMEVTQSTPGIAEQPAPTVLFVGFGASSLDFSIRSWTNNFGDWVKIRSDLHVRVYEALRQDGIEIPFPQQDLHLRSVSNTAIETLAMRRLPPGAAGPAEAEPAPAA
jgi:potassium-dependent mechanosensitive channel